MRMKKFYEELCSKFGKLRVDLMLCGSGCIGMIIASIIIMLVR